MWKWSNEIILENLKSYIWAICKMISPISHLSALRLTLPISLDSSVLCSMAFSNNSFTRFWRCGIFFRIYSWISACVVVGLIQFVIKCSRVWGESHRELSKLHLQWSEWVGSLCSFQKNLSYITAAIIMAGGKGANPDHISTQRGANSRLVCIRNQSVPPFRGDWNCLAR